MPWSRELAQLPTPMIATRTFLSERALPFVVPLFEAIASFPFRPSRSESVPTISSFTVCLRSAARLTRRSFSSGGILSNIDPPSRGALPTRPLGSNGTPKPAARWPTATSLTLRPLCLTSSASRRLSSRGIRTNTLFRASTGVLAAYQGQALGLPPPFELLPYRPDPLSDGDPRRRGEQVDRPLQTTPRSDGEAEADDDHSLGARADPDVPFEAERLGLRARVGNEERRNHCRESEQEGRL